MARPVPFISSDSVENRLRRVREAQGFSQADLASQAGITRQAVYAIEAGEYLPTTGVALRLAGALGCRVEDLFSLSDSGDLVEGTFLGGGAVPPGRAGARVKVASVGGRVVVRPVATLGTVLNFTVSADGLMVGPSPGQSLREGGRVRVRLLRDRRSIEEEVTVAGCDPSIFLAGEYLRRRQGSATVVGWTMGSAAALQALLHGQVHAAGVHVVDDRTGEHNLPFLRRHLKKGAYTVVTFAAWEQGLLVASGNPKGIRTVADVNRKGVTLVNREEGAGARLLLDRHLAVGGIKPSQVRGYQRLASSHLDVARQIAEGQADVGVGVRSAATLLGLSFVPLQEERYDLVMPTAYLFTHPGLSMLLDTMTTRTFRREIESLGGYDVREMGTRRDLHGPSDVSGKP
jgi:molybdate-binding protein/DNA-binding XRE family transcriptional regulator